MTAHARRAAAREEGSALILAVVMMGILSGLTLLLLGSTQVSQRQSVEAGAKERAQLAVDGGLQHVISRVSATDGGKAINSVPFPGPNPDDVTGWLAFGTRNGEYRFRVTDPDSIGSGEPTRVNILARVQTSAQGTGAYVYAEVEALLEPGDTHVSSPAPFTLDTEPGFEVEHDDPDRIKVATGPAGTLSGKNHKKDGSLNLSGDDADAALSMTELYNEEPRLMDWDTADVDGTINGATENGDDDPTPQGLPDDVVQSVRTTDPDTEFTLDDDDTLSFSPTDSDTIGTESDPQFVKVTVEDEHEGNGGQISLSGNTVGHGILMVEISESDWDPDGGHLLEIDGKAGWKGLVVIRIPDGVEADLKDMSSLVHVNGGGGPNHKQMLGSMAILGEGSGEIHFDHSDPAPLLSTNGGGEVAYSPEAMEEYANPTLQDPGNLQVVSYRTPAQGVLPRD